MKKFKKTLSLILILMMVLSYGSSVSFLVGSGEAYALTETTAENSDQAETSNESDRSDSGTEDTQADDSDSSNEDEADGSSGSSAENETSTDDAGAADAEKSESKASEASEDSADSGESGNARADETGNAEASDVIVDDDSAIDADTEAAEEEKKVRKRTIKVVAKRGSAFKKKDNGEKKATAEYKGVQKFWNALAGRDADLKKDGDDEPLVLKIKGKLPEDVSAEATFFEFDETEEYEDYKEAALFALEIKLRDADGNNYVPEKPLTVQISGERLADSSKAGDELLVYSYEENKDREKAAAKAGDKVYAADVLVYRSDFAQTADAADKGEDHASEAGYADPLYELYDEGKTYKNNKDAVRCYESAEGYHVTDKNKIVFDYSYGITLDAEAEDDDDEAFTDSARFVLSAKKFNESAEDSEDKKKDGSESADGEEKASDGEDKQAQDAESKDAAEGKKADSDDSKFDAGKLTASDDKTYKVTVSYGEDAGLPDGLELDVQKISKKNESYAEYVDKAEVAVDADSIDSTYVFDITLVDPKTGEHYQPDENVKVSIELLKEEIKGNEEVDVVHLSEESSEEKSEKTETEDSNSESESESKSDSKAKAVDEDPKSDAKAEAKDTGLKAEVMDTRVNRGSVEFTTDGFSVYVMFTYTVDFHWGDYTYSIKGESEVLLSEILEKLGVTEITIADVKNVSFSNSEYVKISRIEPEGDRKNADWKLKSLAPFTTEETLTLSLNNGQQVNIKVTDEQDDPGSTVTIPDDYELLSKRLVDLEGNRADWEIVVNPDGYAVNEGNPLTLKDNFNPNTDSDGNTIDVQSIDYSSVEITGDGVSYDYRSSTGTFVIPDSTAVTITYSTRIKADPGETKEFGNTAQLLSGDEVLAEKSVSESSVIYPNASEASTTGNNYKVKLFVYENAKMQTGVANAQFILLDANQRAMTYKKGDNAGDPVTFTTGTDGCADIELDEEAGDVTIEKNTGYYLEMIKAPDGYKRDSNLYSFMITDDPDYESGGIWKYYNGDTLKVRLYPEEASLNVSMRFSGNYSLTEDQQNNIELVLQKKNGEDWEDIESHLYSEFSYGSLTFDKGQEGDLFDVDATYRVIQKNQTPWNLPATVILNSTYYLIIGSGDSLNYTEPQEFTVTSENVNSSFNVVINNEYEEPKLTITKLDKKTGETLEGAVFTVKKASDDSEVKTYTTDEDGVVVISGGTAFESEVLYYVVETAAPNGYLLPLEEARHYFYFCNDSYLIPEILSGLPDGETAVNLSEYYDNISIDNQAETTSIPVMKVWQDNTWLTNVDHVVVGLYQSVDGETPTPVLDDNGIHRTVSLSSSAPYNETAFTGLPTRDDNNKTITYSIVEEHIMTGVGNDILSQYAQEYGISDSGVYIVRNKEAKTLTVSSEWYKDGSKVTDASELAAQPDIVFDIYRTTTKIDETSLTNDDMTDRISASGSKLTKVRSDITFGNDEGWTKTIDDLDKHDDAGNSYYYYILETVPSFGTEVYSINSENGAITIKNQVVSDTSTLTVKKELEDDPRPESADTEFKFTLRLKKGSHMIRNWTVYDDEDDSKDLVTDENGEISFTLKSDESETFTLPVVDGVTATVVEEENPEYTVRYTGSAESNNSECTVDVTDSNKTVTCINKLHVVCKVINPNGTEQAFESLKSAVSYIRANSSVFTNPVTIYMLTDYTMPVTDLLDVQEGEEIILTTAPTGEGGTTLYSDTQTATITHAGAGGSMITNAGSLTIKNVILDGGGYKSTADGGLINNTSTGTLNLPAVTSNDEETSLRNSVSAGKGGAVYSEGVINIGNGVTITGNSAPYGSAIYLADGNMNMAGGSISGNTGASDGAVAAMDTSCRVNLSGDPTIHGNTNTDGNEANLYLGVDSDKVIYVVNPGLDSGALIGVTAIDGHNEISEQFATAEYKMTANLNCFINDAYDYRGKLKDGTTTNIIWNGLTLNINKIVDETGANANDRFTITLSSRMIKRSTYLINGTVDYTVTLPTTNAPGKIVFRNVRAGQEISVSPLPIGEYTITESDSNYEPTYTGTMTSSGEPLTIAGDGSFALVENSDITVTNTRKTVSVNLKKTLEDRLIESTAEVPFNYSVKLTESDGTLIRNFPLADDISTGTLTGEATFRMSPTTDTAAVQNLTAPVGALMTITEVDDFNSMYKVTTSAVTVPEEGTEGTDGTDGTEVTGTEIADEDTDNDNVFAFTVTEDDAAVTFDNERKMARIELRKELVGKVSKEESFDLHVTLIGADQNPVAVYTAYEDEQDATNNITTDDNGKAEISFVIGENESSKSVTLTIPEGTKLTVSEDVVKKTINGAELAIYNTTYAVDGGSAVTGNSVTINSVSDDNESIVFTNTRKTQTITVSNTVSGYSGNTSSFTFHATVTDGNENDYDENGFSDGTQSFELATGQSKQLVVPYGATFQFSEDFVVGYETTVKKGSTALTTTAENGLVSIEDFTIDNNCSLNVTNGQLIKLVLVNNTASDLRNINVAVGYGTTMYLVNEDQTGQEALTVTNRTTTIATLEARATATLAIQHETKVDAEQTYTVTSTTPADGYYYTIKNEASYHEFSDPAILRVYDSTAFQVAGKLRYSTSDATVTISAQPLVSFDANGGVWTTEMEGYHDRDGNGNVYQIAVNSGSSVDRPVNPVYPTAEGVELLGWTTDSDFANESHTEADSTSDKLYDFSSTVSAPVSLYAVWKIDRDTRTVTVKNAVNKKINVTVTLTDQNDDPRSDVTLASGVTTDSDGKATLELSNNATKNLNVPEGAKLVIETADDGCITYSSTFTDANSADASYTIASVEKDGTVAFIAGICKITDSNGDLLYDNKGEAAVYSTLSDAFAAYTKQFYIDKDNTEAGTAAAVKMLVEDYTVDEYSTNENSQAPIVFPTLKMTLTTAGKTDSDFPYAGMKNSATLTRPDYFKNCMFRFKKNGTGDVTVTDIIMDGKNVSLKGALVGCIINVESGGTLTVDSGAVFRNTSGSTDSKGGAIGIDGGAVNVYGGTFKNLCTRRGGAIYATGDSTLNINATDSNIKFTDCSTNTNNSNDNGGSGGAIYYDATDPLTINAKRINGEAGIVFQSCSTSSNAGSGGAIYYLNSQNALTINGNADGINDKNQPGILFESCKVVSNSNSSHGGAIYANTSYKKTVNISGCAFTECSSKGVTGSTAEDGYGGGVLCGKTINGLNMSYCTVSNCDSMACGGGIVANITNNSTVTLSNCSFDQCNCKGQGGAIALYPQSWKNQSLAGQTTLNVTGCEFTNCSSGTNNGSGGAIQSYVPRMEFTDTDFTDCWAGKEGGAINNWYDQNGRMWTGSYCKVHGCNFTHCRAEDRYKLDDAYHFGGGIATKAMTLVVDDNSVFEDCVSTLKQGGAIHCSGIGSDSSATIINSKFKNCQAKSNGGALLASNETMTIRDSQFYGCSSFAENGGAVYHGDSVNKMTQTRTTITGCTFSANPNGGETAVSCSSAKSGGAIWTKGQHVTISECEIKDCVAGGAGSGDGGGVYLSLNGSQETTINDCTITGNSAVWGSAVFVSQNGTATFSGTDTIGTTVTGNVAQNADACALEVGYGGGKMYFEGNVVVKDNTCSNDSSCNHDVRMQFDSSTIIHTTSNGLSGAAEIGVYVNDNAYSKHGTEGKPFGTMDTTEGGNGNSYLDGFFNDRHTELKGCEITDNYIYWGIHICKITDANGNTLKRSNNRDAVYRSLTLALSDFESVTGGEPKYIKMLTETYNIMQNEQISNFPSAAFTLTTERYTGEDAVEGKYDGKYPYRGTEGTVCTISRTNSTNQLFYLKNASTTFSLENITLDGRKDKSSERGEYRLIQVDSGALAIETGTTIQYGYSSHGGAIYAGNSSATVTVNGHYDGTNEEATVKFINCAANGDNNGGAIYANSLTITNDSTVNGNCGTVFTSCTAARGGAVCVTGSRMDITGASFTDCHCNYEGGALYHNNTGGHTTIVDNCSFNSCYTGKPGVNSKEGNDWSYGGAITSKVSNLTVTNSTFDDCYALSDGGAINHGARENNSRNNTTLQNNTFTNCRTTGSYGANGYGGAVCTRGKVVNVTGCTMEDCTATHHGGALYCFSNDSNASSGVTISGSTFNNCSVSRTDGRGGAISSRSKRLTLCDYVNANGKTIATKISGCSAEGYSGAVHMDIDDNQSNTNLSLSISGSTEISGCYANQGAAIYLNSSVTMNISGSPVFSKNGYMSVDGTVYNAEKGACIYLAEDSKVNLSGSPYFSRNNITDQGKKSQARVTNGGTTDYVRQDLYLAGYSNKKATSINVKEELEGDAIWVWPEEDLHQGHQYPSDQFATTLDSIGSASLNKLRNALPDETTGCTLGEYLAGVRLPGKDAKDVYWSKVYSVSFKKIDNKAVAVEGAEFTLYEDSNCTIPFASATSADGVSDVAEGELLSKGTVYFPTIPIDIYYLKETVVPESFQENNTTYVMLVGTPSLHNDPIWDDSNGPLSAPDARQKVIKYTEDVGMVYGVFPLGSDGKAVFDSGNLAASDSGIINIRRDFEAYFMKVDSSGASLPGAGYTIYSQQTDDQGEALSYDNHYPKLSLWSRDGENYPGAVISADGTKKYKKLDGSTVPKGMVYFAELPIGTYYLVETVYPERNGNNRKTNYVQNDRVFKLVVNGIVNGVSDFVMSEWQEDGTYTECSKQNGYYVVSNEEAVVKLTKGSGLLYYLGHDGKTRLPAVYPTMNGGFSAAQTGVLYDKDGNVVADDTNNPALQVQVLRDLTLTEPISIDSVRDLTLTTASTRTSSNDRYVFFTTRTYESNIAELKRGYTADESSDSLITIGSDTSSSNLTLQNIKLNGQKANYRGRAVHVMSGSLSVGTNVTLANFKTASGSGGVVLMESDTTLDVDGGNKRTAYFSGNEAISGGALALSENCTVSISNAQFKSNTASINGGAVITSGTTDPVDRKNLPLKNVVFTGNSANGSGGALCCGKDYKVTTDNGTFSGNSAKKGGAIYTEADAVVTLSGGKIQSNTASDQGGAVYVCDDAEVTLSGDPQITKNTAATGAGIYLASGSTLNLSGKPNFGGDGIKANGKFDTTNGNFATGSLSGKTNGGVSYTKKRQDIYIDEANANDPASLVVTGDLTGYAGTIWVWASSEYHYKQYMPFAKVGEGISFVEFQDADGDTKLDASHLKVFRNAQDDSTTENSTDTYLYGTIEGETEGFAYWSGGTGSRKIILRKVNSSYESLPDAKFTVYRGSSIEPYEVKNLQTGVSETLADLESTASGVFWAGYLPVGTYYINETSVPLSVSQNGTEGWWYTLEVSAEGVTMSEQRAKR